MKTGKQDIAMKTCRDCERFLGFTEKHETDQYGRPLDWSVFQCNRADIPREERTYSEQNCMMSSDGIYRLYSGLGNTDVFAANDCIRFKPKTDQTTLF